MGGRSRGSFDPLHRRGPLVFSHSFRGLVLLTLPVTISLVEVVAGVSAAGVFYRRLIGEMHRLSRELRVELERKQWRVVCVVRLGHESHRLLHTPLGFCVTIIAIGKCVRLMKRLRVEMRLPINVVELRGSYSSGVYICNSIVNDFRHGNFICK